MKVLDEEHERCEAALAQLKKLRNVTALRELLAAYDAHLNPHRSPSPNPNPNPNPAPIGTTRTLTLTVAVHVP